MGMDLAYGMGFIVNSFDSILNPKSLLSQPLQTMNFSKHIPTSIVGPTIHTTFVESLYYGYLQHSYKHCGNSHSHKAYGNVTL